jgi:hypothetical protein
VYNGSFQKRSTLIATEEISVVQRGRGEIFVSDNSKGIRISKEVGGLTSNFLHEGGMDVFCRAAKRICGARGKSSLGSL